MIIGIDPGWASCGYALIDSTGKLISSGHLVPRDYLRNTRIKEAVDELMFQVVETIGLNNKKLIKEAYIERYVAYKGIHSDMSESILMYIGALVDSLERIEIKVNMVRAIDWKPEVCKYLFRTKGFQNPSQTFDKKFSIAAATALSGKSFKTDHEADAVCLSYLKQVEENNKDKKDKKK